MPNVGRVRRQRTDACATPAAAPGYTRFTAREQRLLIRCQPTDSALSDAGSSSVRTRTTGTIGPPLRDADSLCNPCGVAANAVDHHGRHRRQEVQTDEIESRLARDHAEMVFRFTVSTEDRQVDP